MSKAGFARISAIGFGLLGLILVGLPNAKAPATGRKSPNVILIQVDDMARNLLRAKLKIHGRQVPVMPNLLRGVANHGTALGRYYSSQPLCGPSRVSLLSGRATHNHGMLTNSGAYGYPVWRNSRFYRQDLPVWLQQAGYRTAHIGKYINNYGTDRPTEVPPGWDRWVTPLRERGPGYYGVDLNVDGRVVPNVSDWDHLDPANCRPVFYTRPGACRYSTDVYTNFALKEIADADRSNRPFYLQLDYNAPHEDGRMDPGPTPPTRLRKLFRNVVPGYVPNDPRPGPDAPVFIREQPPVSASIKQETQHRWANEALALRGVDQGIGRILRLLKRRGQLRDTYVIFTSDNGLFHGEHRISYGKYLPQEPSTHLPFLVRGPGLPAGKVSAATGSSLDVAPTVLAMARVRPTQVLDGHSLLGDLREPRRRSNIPVLLEGFNGRGSSLSRRYLDSFIRSRPNQAMILNYTGFVAGRWKYVRYSYGEQELYDLQRDPGEQQNLAARPGMAPVLRWAEAIDTRLASCSGASCRRPVRSPKRP